MLWYVIRAIVISCVSYGSLNNSSYRVQVHRMQWHVLRCLKKVKISSRGRHKISPPKLSKHIYNKTNSMNQDVGGVGEETSHESMVHQTSDLDIEEASVSFDAESLCKGCV
jgi:hypothetical protein